MTQKLASKYFTMAENSVHDLRNAKGCTKCLHVAISIDEKFVYIRAGFIEKSLCTVVHVLCKYGINDFAICHLSVAHRSLQWIP